MKLMLNETPSADERYVIDEPIDSCHIWAGISNGTVTTSNAHTYFGDASVWASIVDKNGKETEIYNRTPMNLLVDLGNKLLGWRVALNCTTTSYTGMLFSIPFSKNAGTIILPFGAEFRMRIADFMQYGGSPTTTIVTGSRRPEAEDMLKIEPFTVGQDTTTEIDVSDHDYLCIDRYSFKWRKAVYVYDSHDGVQDWIEQGMDQTYLNSTALGMADYDGRAPNMRMPAIMQYYIVDVRTVKRVKLEFSAIDTVYLVSNQPLVK